MDRVEKKLRLSDKEFKRNVGTTKPVFQMMREILQQAHGKLHPIRRTTHHLEHRRQTPHRPPVLPGVPDNGKHCH